MKYYVFLTASIYPIGGMQTYVAGKATYLEMQGWKVNCFFSGHDGNNCAIPSLDKYRPDETEELCKVPGQWPAYVRCKVIKRMAARILEGADNTKDIIIESQDEKSALWGELLAEKLKAKHVCFICNELFRGPEKYYSRYLDFFDFKHKRKELTGIHENSLNNLFGEYKKVKENERYHFWAAMEDPVQDVENELVDALKRHDWNICYLGRASKSYVEGAIMSVEKLAQKYPEISIQFVMVGNAESRKGLLEEKLGGLSNVVLSLLGDMYPIPRKLFSKLDVVMAGSGSAYCAAHEHIPTIAIHHANGLANGILGYTTNDTLFCDESQQKELTEALIDVLVNRVQDSLKFSLPEKIPASYYYEQHMKFVEESCSEQDYYQDIAQNVKVDYKNYLKYILRHHLPWTVILYRRLRGRRGIA